MMVLINNDKDNVNDNRNNADDHDNDGQLKCSWWTVTQVSDSFSQKRIEGDLANNHYTLIWREIFSGFFQLGRTLAACFCFCPPQTRSSQSGRQCCQSQLLEDLHNKELCHFFAFVSIFNFFWNFVLFLFVSARHLDSSQAWTAREARLLSPALCHQCIDIAMHYLGHSLGRWPPWTFKNCYLSPFKGVFLTRIDCHLFEKKQLVMISALKW